jgi:multicomponent Na+:H+ antiporter subunit A
VTLETLTTALWPILVGGALAILLGRWGYSLAYVPLGNVVIAVVGPARRMALALGGVIERVGEFRQWPAAASRSWRWRSCSA